MSAPPPAAPIVLAPSDVEQARDGRHGRARARPVPVKPKPAGSKTPPSDSSMHDVIGELGLVRDRGSPLPPRIAVLLVGEEHDAHRAARPQVELLHQPHRLPRHDAAAAVVGRARADVPRVEVAADDDDLVRQLAAAHLADDVVRDWRRDRSALPSRASRGRARRGPAAAASGRRPRPESPPPESSARRPRSSSRAGVRRAQAGRADRAHEHRDRAELRRARRARRDDTRRVCAVVRERHVEEHDACP